MAHPVNDNERIDDRGGIPFDNLRKETFYSEANQSRLKQSIDSLNSGNGKVHEIIEDSHD